MWLGVVVLILFSLLPSDIKDNPELLRGIGFFILGVGIAPLGLLLAYRRTETVQIQATTAKEKAVTEAFAKSVELLGNERESARQGGIYALGRLAKDNEDLHPMIMDIAASYIRQESRRWFYSEKKKMEKEENTPIDKERLIEKLDLEPTPMDIEAAITVIRQRITKYDKKTKKKQYLMDLSNAYIFNADFSNTKLSKVNFSDSVMINCIFDETDLSKSNFVASTLTGSSMTNASISDADFSNTKLSKVNFSDSVMINCIFDGADLSGSNFVASNLTGSSMTQEQVDSMGYTNGTTFPEELVPPEEQQ